MRSRAARLTLGALAWVALAAAFAFFYVSETQIKDRQVSLRAFDLHAREAADMLAELRAAEQAYVAAGQGINFWIPKVAADLDSAQRTVASLRQAAASPDAKTSLDEAAGTLTDFTTVDKRARDYLKAGQQLMAADVIFTEGGEGAANAARQVEAARVAEHQAADAADSSARKYDAAALGAAAFLGILAISLLVPAGRRDTPGEVAETNAAGPIVAPASVPDENASASGSSARAVSPVLKAAADLCTQLGTAGDVSAVGAALAHAAQVMDASGLIVWLGDSNGADLHPVLSHGYNTQMIARMPAVPRTADNAAAKAYRSGTLQIVLSRPGSANGAIVAPLISPDGCIGAFSAEINGGGEAADSVQALAAIFAAQLAGIFQATAAAEPRNPGDAKTAAASS